VVATAYGVDIADEAVCENLSRIGGQIFKLLPMWEEGKDWKKPLQTLIVELVGLSHLVPNLPKLVTLVAKMEGLKECCGDNDFLLYRRTVFECCSLVEDVKKQCQ
jgi:hypothetical protein